MAEHNGSTDQTRLYLDAVQAQLGERVTNLGRRQSDLETEMRTGFRTIESSIASLSTTLSERNKPQWQALSVMLAFAAMLGALAYMPIREATTDLKADVAGLAASTVSRQEMDWRASRGVEDRARMENALDYAREHTVPRMVWEERNRARDTEIANINLRMEEIRTQMGSVYGTRDVILDLQQEVDSLRARLNDKF